MSTNEAVPWTKAGRLMLRRFGTYTDLDGLPITDRILAIEAEAHERSAGAASLDARLIEFIDIVAADCNDPHLVRRAEELARLAAEGTDR